MIHYVQGNLFGVKDGVIAHGCNSLGAFGSGVAGQIQRIYPKVAQKYRMKHAIDGWVLGDCQAVRVSDSLVIINMCTQFDCDRDKNVVYANYGAIQITVGKVLKYCSLHDNQNLSMPKIGSGLGGGDWPTIEKIILEEMEAYAKVKVTIYTLE